MDLTKYWYNEPKGEAHSSCYATVEAIYNDEIRKYEDMKRFATLYRDEGIVGFDPGEFRRSYDDFDKPVSYNVVRSCTDSLLSKITLNKPHTRFLTSGGTEDLQEKARLKEKFVSAVMKSQGAYEKAVDAFRDACIYGHGILKVYPQDGNVNIEVVHPSRIVVDNNSALDCPPRTMWQRSWLDKPTLKNFFPKSKGEIEGANVKVVGNASVIRDLVKVWEVWHLGFGDKPGRHMIFTENATFLDEPYISKKFPFCVIRYADDILGWFGIGLANQLEGIQVEINELLLKIQANMDLLAAPYVLKEKGSEVEDEHLLSNKMARMIEYVGTPPQVITPPAMNPQVFQHLEQLYQRAFEIAGISQLSATSKKPGGLNSGVALRTFHDIETQRFSTIARRWENMFVELADRIISCAKGLVSEEGFIVKFVDQDKLEKINFLDCELDEDSYVLDIYPTSSLPKTPAGRLQDVIELLQSGMIAPDEGRQLLDFPDLEKSNRLATASRDDLEALFEHMLGKGIYIDPLPYQDLETGIQLGVSYYLRAKMDGIKQSRLDLVLRWLDEASDMLQPPAPPPEMAPLPPPTLEGEQLPMPPAATQAMPQGQAVDLPEGVEPPPGAVPVEGV